MHLECDPQEYRASLFTISQSITQIEKISCGHLVVNRYVHNFRITNQCFSFKHEFRVNFLIDAQDTGKICDELEIKNCKGGTCQKLDNILARTPEPYWQGKEFVYVNPVCWIENSQYPIFNIHIEINWRSRSAEQPNGGITGPLKNIPMRVYGRL